MQTLHQFQILEGPNGVQIVFDAETLALLEADEESIGDLMSAAKTKDLSTLNPVAIQCLEGAGLISSPAAATKRQSLSINAFRVVLTERCNFRCPECFVTNQAAHLRTMNQQTIREVVAKATELSGGKPFTFHFFGGEPLLQMKLIRTAVEVTEQARSQGLIEPAYAITTNLTLIDEAMAKFFKQFGFRVGVSIDGPAEINDRYRVYHGGRSTYSDVAEKYELLTRHDIDTFILITPHKDSVAELPDIFTCLVRRFETKRVTVNTPFRENSFGWDVDGKMYVEALVEIERRAKQLGIKVDSALTPPLSALSNATPRQSACSILGNSTMASVAPDGTVSPCPQNWQSTVPLSDVQGCQKVLVSGRSRSCKKCISRNICGGPCRLFCHLSSQSLDSARCDFMRNVPRLVAKNLDLFVEATE